MDSKAKTRLFQLKTHRDRLLAGAADSSLSQVMDSSACQTILSQCVAYRERIYTPFQTVFTFIKQVLHPDKSCRHAVAGVVVEHTALKNKTVSPHTGSYCKARYRLPGSVVKALVIETGTSSLKKHRINGRLMVVN